MIKSVLIIPLVILILFSTNTFANTPHAALNVQDSVGEPGDASKVTRIVKLTQVDYMFLPNEIWITQGETISFVVKNRGDHRHEMLIGTKKDLKKAVKMRRMFPDKDHSEPGLIQLEPGEQKEIIWHFDQAGTIEFACPLPGHSKGMRGIIYVEKK
ncbi:plastocyanin/azurin family copper-binding protein [Nitrosomonas sp.]|uniref:cupredoxin domain-containing protein n=1 Tax=Nitrosomonas sp. TaxID=42353 RepID=UPI00208D8EB6|nr:plastocyanin/azurin family copper-binding protein [Nitrosomonas sp.]GJL76694.1 MAG: copper oxidase [Nitrosomonas sp.]